MNKRVKFESVFINHLGNPVYCTEDEIKEQYIKHVLIPWFIISKRNGLPKDLVKMIAGMLGKYHECPLWREILWKYEEIVSKANCPIYRSKDVLNGEKHFDFYAELVRKKLSNDVHIRLTGSDQTRRGINLHSFWYRKQVVFAFVPSHSKSLGAIDFLIKN